MGPNSKGKIKMWSQVVKLSKEQSDALMCDGKNMGSRSSIYDNSLENSPDFRCAAVEQSDESDFQSPSLTQVVGQRLLRYFTYVLLLTWLSLPSLTGHFQLGIRGSCHQSKAQRILSPIKGTDATISVTAMTCS